MGAIFGYLGAPAPGLLNRMAGILGHRCQHGWELMQTGYGPELRAEIGHGLAPWAKEKQCWGDKAAQVAFAHSGVLFQSNPLFNTNGLYAHPPSPAEALAAMDGAFAGALAVNGQLYLVRDPAGVKALYWTRHGHRLVFASEIKALFADPKVARRMRPAALTEYLSFSFVPGENTMFADIHELQPGCVLTADTASVNVRRHFAFESQEPDPSDLASADHYVTSLRGELEASVAQCCRIRKSPPAVFLSGGIDSSAVCALAARACPETRLKTFSVHFGRRYANENAYVQMMVDRYRTDHTWLAIQPKQFLKQMAAIIWKLDDPIGDPITVPNYLLSQAGARVATVVLNGEGGDPCFGGPKNLPMMMARLYGPLPDDPPDTWLENHYLISYRKCFTDLKRLLSPELFRQAGGTAHLRAILSPFFHAPQPHHFLNKLMAINIRLKGANLILVKVDKMSSANGILALPPLFNRRIIETAMACPPQFKLHGNVEKWVLKQAVADIVPGPIVQRPKSGMMVPVRFWLQKEMRRYARRILSKRRLKNLGFFNPDYVRKLLRYDKAEIGSARYGLKLWMLITFVLWYEQMVEGRRDLL